MESQKSIEIVDLTSSDEMKNSFDELENSLGELENSLGELENSDGHHNQIVPPLRVHH